MRAFYASLCLVSAAFVLADIPCLPGAFEDEDALRREFQRRYAAWREEQRRHVHSNLSDETKCKSYDDIVALGVRAAPILVEEIDKHPKDFDRMLLQAALERITRRKFKPAGGHPAVFYLCPEVVVAWWKARPQAPIEFEKHYAQWKQAKAKGISTLETTEKVYDDARKEFVSKTTKTELGKAYEAIREMGIESMPFVMEKLRGGDADLLPLIAELTNDEGTTPVRTLEFRVQYTLGWWEGRKDKWLLPPVSAAKLRDTKP